MYRKLSHIQTSKRYNTKYKNNNKKGIQGEHKRLPVFFTSINLITKFSLLICTNKESPIEQNSYSGKPQIIKSS